MGAPHARLLVRSLLKKLSERVAAITVIQEHAHVENEERYQRTVGYDSLVVHLAALKR
ncbi:MAG: hypothetical protein ACKOHM_09930 [Spartobacteria bacterium]